MLLLARGVAERQEKGSVGTSKEFGLESWNEKIKARVDEAKLLREYRNWVCAPCFPMELLVLLQSS